MFALTIAQHILLILQVCAFTLVSLIRVGDVTTKFKSTVHSWRHTPSKFLHTHIPECVRELLAPELWLVLLPSRRVFIVGMKIG